MNGARAIVAKLNQGAALTLLWIYKRVLAPSLHAGVPGACCFQPTCSEYAAIAIAEHGVLRGGAMAAWRVVRCHPLNRGGYDPVPANRFRSKRFSGGSDSHYGCTATQMSLPVAGTQRTAIR